MTGPASYSADGRTHFVKHFKNNFCSEFFPIVCMENLWIANDPKIFLQLKDASLAEPLDSIQISESCGVILDGHDPAHENTKGIPLP